MPTIVNTPTRMADGTYRNRQVTYDGEDEQRYLSPDRLRAAYLTIRQWSADAAQVNDGWDTMTALQKDNAMRETIRRLGLFFDRFADLLLLDERT
jgi:hypothetical protein